MALTMKAIAAAKAGKTRKLFGDGAGLYLQVTPGGVKSWVLRYQLNGKRRDMGLGSVELVGLEEARRAALDARKLCRQGVDPIEARRRQIAAAAVDEAKRKTFDECCTLYLEARGTKWRNADHAQQWRNSIARYASPVIGSLPVHMVDTAAVIAVLEPVWKDKPETGSRLRQRIEAVLDLAATRGHRPADPNPARWNGHLEHTFTKRTVKDREHHAALSYAELGPFVAELRENGRTVARALEFTILCASRTGEVLGARWEEFDLSAKLWTIPAERMKAKREHRVPLSDAAVALLGEPGEPNALVFPLPSRNAMANLLKAMRPGTTVHGFRSSFRDWGGERTNHPREVLEMALAHTLDSRTEAAYARGDLFEKRRRLMDEWARFCAVMRTAPEVVVLRA